MKVWRSILLSLVFSSAVWAITADFQSDSLRGSLGDVIAFKWLLEHDTADSIFVHDHSGDLGSIEVLNTELVAGSQHSELQFETAVYDSVGVYHFPNLVVYTLHGKELDSLFLRGPDIEIYSVLTPADSAFRDIKGLHHIRGRLPLWLFAVVLALLFLAFLGYRLYGRRNAGMSAAKEAELVIVPPEEAHVIALRELEKLRREKYLRLHQFKIFHSELIHILKLYLERRYLIDALELTTSELMEDLQTFSELTQAQTQLIRKVLELADLIKFAKAESNEVESGDSLNQVVTLVNQTKIESNDQGDDP